MQKKVIKVMTSLAAAFCAPVLAATTCTEELRAINTANYIGLMKTPPLSGDVRSVQISSTRINLNLINQFPNNTTTNSLTISPCGQLEKRLFIAKTHLSDDMLLVMTSDLQYQKNGWVMKAKNDLHEKGKITTTSGSTRQIYTDKQGRISHAISRAQDSKKQQTETNRSFLYDEQQRLVREKVSTVTHHKRSHDVIYEFHYDAQGRISQISGSDRKQTFRWDDKGRLLFSEDIKQNKGLELVRSTTCSVWDKIGNCTAATLDEVERSADGDDQENIARTSLSYQYQYWGN